MLHSEHTNVSPLFHSCCMLQGRNISIDDSDEEEAPEITQWEAIGWLAILTLWVSLLSGYLVDAIQVKTYCRSFSLVL